MRNDYAILEFSNDDAGEVCISAEHLYLLISHLVGALELVSNHATMPDLISDGEAFSIDIKIAGIERGSVKILLRTFVHALGQHKDDIDAGEKLLNIGGRAWHTVIWALGTLGLIHVANTDLSPKNEIILEAPSEVIKNRDLISNLEGFVAQAKGAGAQKVSIYIHDDKQYYINPSRESPYFIGINRNPLSDEHRGRMMGSLILDGTRLKVILNGEEKILLMGNIYVERKSTGGAGEPFFRVEAERSYPVLVDWKSSQAPSVAQGSSVAVEGDLLDLENVSIKGLEKIDVKHQGISGIFIARKVYLGS